MQHFVDDDAGYQRWLTNQPDGFVINTYRTPSTVYLVLHRSTPATPGIRCGTGSPRRWSWSTRAIPGSGTGRCNGGACPTAGSISARPAHPALVSVEDFIAAHGIRVPREGKEGERCYRLAGILRCGLCGRRLESCWSNGRAAYRSRHGHSSASTPDTARPKNLYIREDRILPRLATLYLLLTTADPVPGRRRRRTRGGTDVQQPVSEDHVRAGDVPPCPKTGIHVQMACPRT